MVGQRCEDISDCGGNADSAGAGGDFFLAVITGTIAFSKQFGTKQPRANVTNHLISGTCLRHKHFIRQHFFGPDSTPPQSWTNLKGRNIIFRASTVEQWEENLSNPPVIAIIPPAEVSLGKTVKTPRGSRSSV